MPAHTGAQSGCDFLRDIHAVPSLVIQAQHRGLFLLRDKGLHLHIAGGKQGAGNTAQINGFLSLINVKSKNFICFFLCFYISMPAAFAAVQGGPCAAFLKKCGGSAHPRASGKPRLEHQRLPELGRQLLAPRLGPAQYPQAGRPA